MAIPSSLKRVFPSFKVNGDKASVNIAEVKKHLPSLEIGEDSGTLTLSLTDLRNLLAVFLAAYPVDEAWYCAQVPALRRDIQKGKFKSVQEHYYVHGFLEGRLPERPVVDEKFYLRTNPDVADGVRSGKFKDGFDHFVKAGYGEGRVPRPA